VTTIFQLYCGDQFYFHEKTEAHGKNVLLPMSNFITCMYEHQFISCKVQNNLTSL